MQRSRSSLFGVVTQKLRRLLTPRICARRAGRLRLATTPAFFSPARMRGMPLVSSLATKAARDWVVSLALSAVRNQFVVLGVLWPICRACARREPTQSSIVESLADKSTLGVCGLDTSDSFCQDTTVSAKRDQLQLGGSAATVVV